MTYGLAGYHIVTPITSQRDKAEHIAQLWIGRRAGRAPRAPALRLVRTAASIEDVIAAIAAEHGAARGGRDLGARRVVSGARAGVTPQELFAEAALDPAPAADPARHRLGPGRRADSVGIPRACADRRRLDWNHLSVRIGRRGHPRSPVRSPGLTARG